MCSKRILVYKGKHGDEFWMADTPERTAGAQAALFQMLDEDGFYDYEEDVQLVERARGGYQRPIELILQRRNGFEYESWGYEEAKVVE
jgi:hypothetical protein